MKIACRTRKLRAVVKRFAPAKHKRVRQDALYLVSVLFEQFYDELRYDTIRYSTQQRTTDAGV